MRVQALKKLVQYVLNVFLSFSMAFADFRPRAQRDQGASGSA
jgi:hypothetical protein